MKIVEMNEGKKIEYEVTGNKICFDDDLTINLAKREEDETVEIDVCFDKDKNLVIGAAAGRAYVAQIKIPARTYEEDVENAAETSGEMPETGTTRKPAAFDIDRITLSLWAI